MKILKGTHIPSVAEDLMFIIESYERGDITPERALELVKSIMSPISVGDATIAKTVAFFWELDVGTVVGNSITKGRKSVDAVARHMFRYFMFKKYDNKSLVANKVNITPGSIVSSLNTHKNLSETDKKYNEILHVISGILKL